MSQEKSEGSAVERLFSKAQLSFNAAAKDLESLRASLNLGKVRPGGGLSELAAGNTACNSGCDGGCAGGAQLEGAVINPAELRQNVTARVSAVLEAHKVQGLDALSKLAAGNTACDSGCDGGCAAQLSDLKANPAQREAG